MWQLKSNVDTDNVFEKIFEKAKYFRKVFKYKYFKFLNIKYKFILKKYLNTFNVWTHLIYYIFELDTLEYAPPWFWSVVIVMYLIMCIWNS